MTVVGGRAKKWVLLRGAAAALGLGAVIGLHPAGSFGQTVTTAPSTGPSTQPMASATTAPDVVAAVDPTPEVVALVNDLGSDEYTKREAAQLKLLDMADAIEGQLHGALKLELNDEARQRVLGIVHKIEENRQLGPSVITMHYQNAPLLDVLTDFTRQCKADLGIHRTQVIEYAKSKRVTINLDHVNFWEALKEVTNQSGLHPQPYSGEARMMLDVGGNQMDLFSNQMVICGAFAVIPQSCTLNRSVTYGRNAGAGGSNLQLQLCAVAEPKLRILSGGNGDWLEGCVDNKKHNIAQEGRGQQMFFNNPRQWWYQLQTPLREVPEMGDRIASLKGRLKFNVQVKSDMVEIDDVLKAHNVSRTAGNNSIVLKQVTTQNNQPNQYQVVLTFASGSGNGGWDQMQTLAAAIELIDQTGERLQSNGMMSGGVTNGHIDMTLMFSSNNMAVRQAQNGGHAEVGAGVPQKLVWEVATEVKELTVPFELKDLDLPHPPVN